MNKNYKSEQNGRSMVEMLGVLAVIGVLSITGISGYTTAMNKHKANEILDAASKRAVAVSTQIQRGNTTPTLAEFDDNEVGGATFDEEVIVSGDKFTIGYTLTDDNVRNQIKSIAGTEGIIRGITESGFIYNNDLTTDARASDFDGNSTNCDTTKYTYCSATGKCIAGVSQTCPESCAAAYTGSTTASGTGAKQIGNTSCYCPANTKWNGSECKSTQKEFYITGPTDHYGAPALCTGLNTTTGGAAWHLTTLSEYFEAIGGKTECSYTPWDEDEGNGNYYNNCPPIRLNFASGSSSISHNYDVLWLAECWDSDDGGNGTTCPIGSGAWLVYGDGNVNYDSRNYDADFYYALCVR